MKSKLTDEDIPDLADLMGELSCPVNSDNFLLLENAATKSRTTVVTRTNRKGRRQFSETVTTRGKMNTCS